MPSHSRTSLLHSVRLALTCAALGVIAASGTHAAELSGSVQRFDIAAQSASDALNEFSKQSGLRLLFSFDALYGKRTGALQGEFTAEQALHRLLSGSGLDYEVTADSVVLIKPNKQSAPDLPSDAGVLETINVFGTLDNELGIGSKSGRTLRETPKSVTVVARERIEIQNLTSLKDILNQATGVTVSTYGPVDNFYYSRGFEVASVQIDGGAAGQMVRGTPDTAAFERVEVLRGVDGIFTGAGDPGGVINLVRKRGQATPQVNVNLSGARWDNYRAEVDLTGPLLEDGRLRGRVVAAYHEGEYFYDAGDVSRQFFFGTAEYDLTASTVLIAGASYEKREEGGFPVGGLPRYSNGGNLGLPRSTVLASDWNYWDFLTREYFARIEQRFGDSGVIRLNYTVQNQDSPYGTYYPTGAVNPVTRTGTFLRANTTQTDYADDRELIDLSVSGRFSLFGREHRYTVGADHINSRRGYAQYRSLDANGNAYPARPIDVFNFDPYAYAPPTSRRLVGTGPSRTEQTGAYVALDFQLSDPLRLAVGGRYTEYDFYTVFQPWAVDGTPAAGRSFTQYDDTAFVPSVALTYELSSHWSTYASYGETFRVQANKLRGPTPGTPLDPMRGVSYELGIKGELFGQLNTALAVYRLERDGEGMRDLSYPITPGDLGSSCCYVDDVAIEVNGLDAEVSGVVRPGWQMFAGYTYADREVTGPTESLLAVTVTPKHQFKLWTTWQLPGALAGITLSSGVTVQSSTSREAIIIDAGNPVPATFVQGGYALWNASLQWRIDDTWSVGLHGDNLLDKTYYSAIGTIDNQNYYGTPRNYVLTLRARW